jgi:hypothetical protein
MKKIKNRPVLPANSQGRSEAECEEAGTLVIDGIRYRPHPELHRQRQADANRENEGSLSGMSPMTIHETVNNNVRYAARLLRQGFAHELKRFRSGPPAFFALPARRGAVGGVRASFFLPRY